jgi:hypothetical protein
VANTLKKEYEERRATRRPMRPREEIKTEKREYGERRQWIRKTTQTKKSTHHEKKEEEIIKEPQDIWHLHIYAATAALIFHNLISITKYIS